MRYFSKIFNNGLLFVLSFIVLLCVLEVAIRLLANFSPRLIQRSADIGGHYRPGLETRLIAPESGKSILVSINQLGFRGPQFPRNKSVNTMRVAILGDSQTAAINMSQTNTLRDVLSTQLAKKFTDVDWQVMDFSVSGASTAQQLNLFRQRVKQYDVDLVICAFYNGNDFSDNSRQLSSNPRIYMHLADGGELVTQYVEPSTGWIQWLKQNSRFYQWQKLKVRAARRNAISRGWLGEKSRVRGGLLGFADKDEIRLNDAWRLNDALLTAFNREVLGNGAEFLLLSIPHSLEFDSQQEASIRKRFSSTPYAGFFTPKNVENHLQEIANRERFPAIFVNDEFRKLLKRGRAESKDYHLAYLDGAGHVNEIGQKVMANRIVQKISIDPNTVSLELKY